VRTGGGERRKKPYHGTQDQGLKHGRVKAIAGDHGVPVLDEEEPRSHKIASNNARQRIVKNSSGLLDLGRGETCRNKGHLGEAPAGGCG
jgi:hypothetical protein